MVHSSARRPSTKGRLYTLYMAQKAKKRNELLPKEVADIRRGIREFLDSEADNGQKIGNSQYGVYAFYDYDGEPIYVGKTHEKLRGRIGRHLTNQRTDAVAMNVLDPFEVAEIEVWPLWELVGREGSDPDVKKHLAAAEYAAFRKALARSAFHAVLNEKDIAPTQEVQLPQSYRARIIPDHLYESRKHPDVRIARRATTIANLARVISERDVSKGLRRTLQTQAKRLESLASKRLSEIGGEFPVAKPGEDD
jgi:hypothetical protein